MSHLSHWPSLLAHTIHLHNPSICPARHVLCVSVFIFPHPSFPSACLLSQHLACLPVRRHRGWGGDWDKAAFPSLATLPFAL